MSIHKIKIKERYSIGEVAMFSGLSIKSLRYYDKKGLLIPSEKDPNTGYRYYSEPQISMSIALNELKRKGFTFSEIKNRLASCSVEELRRSIQDKIPEKEQEIQLLNDQLTRLKWENHQLQTALKLLDESRRAVDTGGVIFREFPEIRTLFTRRVSKAKIRENYWDRNAELLQMRDVNGLASDGPFIGIVHDHYMDYYLYESCDYEMMLPISDPEFEAPFVKTFGGFLTAGIIYQGKYSEIAAIALSLLKTIEQEGYRITGPLIREYLIEFTLGVLHDDPVTRLSFPIEKRRSSSA